MSGEIDLKRFSASPGIGPRFLSDSANPWYGNWLATAGLYYSQDNLPPKATAKIGCAIAAGYNSVYLTFTTPQNFSEMYIDYWIKFTGAVASYNQMVQDSLGAYSYKALTPAAIWTRNIIKIPDSSATFVSGGNSKDRNSMSKRITVLQFEGTLAAPWTMEIGGLTVRRL